MPSLNGVNDNGDAKKDREDGRKLTKLIIDVTGIVQGRFLESNCGRHADVILAMRDLLGQVFDVPVVEIDSPELKSDVFERFRLFNLFDQPG